MPSIPGNEFAQVLIAGDESVQISDQNKQWPALLLELSLRRGVL